MRRTRYDVVHFAPPRIEGNALYREHTATLPLVCLNSSNVVQTTLNRDMDVLGVSSVVSNMLAMPCALLRFPENTLNRAFPSRSVEAHHVGAFAAEYAEKMDASPQELLRIIGPTLHRETLWFDGFTHGAITNIGCIQSRGTTNRKFDIPAHAFLNAIVAGIDEAPAIYWHNVVHALGHNALMKSIYTSNVDFADCSPVRHGSQVIRDAHVWDAIELCEKSTAYRGHTRTCVGGVYHTYFEWSSHADNFATTAYYHCLKSPYVEECLQMYAEFGDFGLTSRLGVEECETLSTRQRYACVFAMTAMYTPCTAFLANGASLATNETQNIATACMRGFTFSLGSRSTLLRLRSTDPSFDADAYIQNHCLEFISSYAMTSVRRHAMYSTCIDRFEYTFRYFVKFSEYDEWW